MCLRAGGGQGLSRAVSDPCVLRTALELDQKGAVAAAPRSFRALLGVLGIEAALESLLRLLCAEGSPVPTQPGLGPGATE